MIGTRLEPPIAQGLPAATVGPAQTASHSVGAEAGDPGQPSPAANPSPLDSSNALAWIAFAKAANPGARPMQDWERQDADEFFWSQFE